MNAVFVRSARQCGREGGYDVSGEPQRGHKLSEGVESRDRFGSVGVFAKGGNSNAPHRTVRCVVLFIYCTRVLSPYFLFVFSTTLPTCLLNIPGLATQ